MEHHYSAPKQTPVPVPIAVVKEYEELQTPARWSPPMRGRGDGRAGSGRRVGPNGRTPPRRPRAWREPSGDIWPLVEEGEGGEGGEEVGLGIVL